MNNFGATGMFPLNTFFSNGSGAFGSQPPTSMHPPAFANSMTNVQHFSHQNSQLQSLPLGSAAATVVGQKTNASDLYSRQSRIYVGSISPKITREQLIAIFNSYGKVTGLSHLKGYAFVQYDNPKSARIASTRENGKSYCGMPFECNVVADDKKSASQVPLTSSLSANTTSLGCRVGNTNQTRSSNLPLNVANLASVLNSRRSGGVNPTVANSNTRTGQTSLDNGNVSNLKRVVVSSSKIQPPVKKPTTVKNQIGKPAATTNAKLMTGRLTNVTADKADKIVVPNQKPPEARVSDCTKSQHEVLTQSADYLICGRCREMFNNVTSFQRHKEETSVNGCQGVPDMLWCFTCDRIFTSPWSLLQHAQNDHSYQMYRTVDRETHEAVQNMPATSVDEGNDDIKGCGAAENKQESASEREEIAIADNNCREGNGGCCDKFGRRRSSLSGDSSTSTVGRADSSSNCIEHPDTDDISNLVGHPTASPGNAGAIVDEDNLLGGRDDMSDV